MKKLIFSAAIMLALISTTTSCEPEELNTGTKSINSSDTYSDTGDSKDAPIPPKGSDEEG